jgi:hypothetical protein
MEITCLTCRRGTNLDHVVFENYLLPVKCFCCNSVVEVQTKEGVLLMVKASIHNKHSFEVRQKEASPIV